MRMVLLIDKVKVGIFFVGLFLGFLFFFYRLVCMFVMFCFDGGLW